MESPLKQRLIGAAVLAALAIIFLPMLLKGPDVKEPDAAEVPLSMPAAPGDAFETRELPLTAPEAAPSDGGVLGMKPAPADAAAAPVAADVADADVVPANSASVAAATTPAAPAAPAAATVAPKPPAAATVPPATAATSPKPATPEPEPSTPATAAGGHALTVGSFANADTAASLSARLRAAGLPVLSERVALASGSATRVRVGPFASRAAAEAARQRVEQISGTPSRAVVLDAAPAPAAAAPAVAATPKPAAPAAPALKPATSTAAAKPAASGFAVQLSAPSVEADANALRDKARAAGFSAFVQRVETDGGARYRVRLGPVADRGAAEAMQTEARAKLGMAGLVVATP